DDVCDLVGILRLRRYQSEKELMVAAEQARRIDQVGVIHRIQDVLQRHVRAKHSRRVGRNLKLGLLPALNQHTGHAIEPVEPRLQIVGSQLPELRLRNLVGGDAVAKNGETGKV